jgi:hypothetical protein
MSQYDYIKNTKKSTKTKLIKINDKNKKKKEKKYSSFTVHMNNETPLSYHSSFN